MITVLYDTDEEWEYLDYITTEGEGNWMYDHEGENIPPIYFIQRENNNNNNLN